MCKKAYVHPAILEWFSGDACLDEAAALRRVRARGRHSAAERRLLAFLARRC
ncbi:hypothetical protein [Caldimonas sp. KR1-144]|uniref:hypothetical protein n=1 Tax=Caldimonas sp. KR1-144 TaxID=3400911 RepID=UPI003C0E52A2